MSNAGGQTQPHATVPLSDLDVAQAHALAAEWPQPPAAVFVSKFLRTQQTAEPLCQRFSMNAQVHPDLHEFSVIDEALVAGLDGPQRKPFVKNYWADPDPQRRFGSRADTFAEFDARVDSFRAQMHQLPNASVIIGHGIWLALLFWQLRGNRVLDRAGMLAFRAFQIGVAMPNCAIFYVTRTQGSWHVKSDVTGHEHVGSI